MSLISRAEKNLLNLQPTFKRHGNLLNIPFILIDSKGHYLQQVSSDTYPENKLIWWNKRGKGVEYVLNWLKTEARSTILN